jgi:hypothetical protein
MWVVDAPIPALPPKKASARYVIAGPLLNTINQAHSNFANAVRAREFASSTSV